MFGKNEKDIEMTNSQQQNAATEKKRKENSEKKHLKYSSKLKKNKTHKDAPRLETEESQNNIFENPFYQPETPENFDLNTTRTHSNDHILGGNIAPTISDISSPFSNQLKTSTSSQNMDPEFDPETISTTFSRQPGLAISNEYSNIEENQNILHEIHTKRRQSFFHPVSSESTTSTTTEQTNISTAFTFDSAYPDVQLDQQKKSGRGSSNEFEEVEDLLHHNKNPIDYKSTRRKSLELEDVETIKKVIAQNTQNTDQPFSGTQRSGVDSETTNEKPIRINQSDSILAVVKSVSPPRKTSEKEIPLAGSITINENISASFTTDVIAQYEKVLVEEFNYNQLIHVTVPEDHPFMKHPNMKPVNDKGEEVNGVATFANSVGHHISGRMSARLFSKNDSCYILLLRKIFTTSDKDRTLEKLKSDLQDDTYFKEFRDGVLVVVIALVRNPKGHIELQLRVIPNADGYGHPGLVFKNEGNDPLCIVVAGEIYILNGVIILVNDKSGNFSEKFGPRGINRKDVFDFMLKPNYSEKYKNNCFYPATKDDAVTVYEVLRRGFPHSLIRPRKLQEKFPIENLPEDIKFIAIATEKDYQLRLANYQKVPLNRTTTTTTTKMPAISDNLVPAPILSDSNNANTSVTKVTVTQTDNNFFTHEKDQQLGFKSTTMEQQQNNYQNN